MRNRKTDQTRSGRLPRLPIRKLTFAIGHGENRIADISELQVSVFLHFAMAGVEACHYAGLLLQPLLCVNPAYTVSDF